MANVRSEAKRAILNALYRATTVEGLLKGLQDFQDRSFSANKSGQSLASSSGAGHSAMFHVLESMPPDEIFGLSQELIETFADAKSSLVSDGNANPTDAQILSQMLLDNRLRGTTESRADFSEQRDFVTR